MKNKQHHNILKAARSLFWKHGFKKVSVEEICSKANISKMTFYRHFPNKIAVAKAVYDEVIDEGTKKFKSILHNETTSSGEKMEQILKLKLEGTNDLSREFLDDFYSNPELGLSSYVGEKAHTVWLELIKEFKLAQDKGWFRKDFKPEAFLIMVNKLNELIAEGKLIALYSSPQEMIMEMARLISYGIMPVEDNVSLNIK